MRSSIEGLVARVARMNVQKATLADVLPPNPHAWRYELKWDGYRILAAKAGKDVRLITRNHQDWTLSFQSVADVVAKLKCEDCVLDGEVCALDERGLPSFQLLQRRQRGPRKLVFAVFDLVWLEGQDLRDRPMEERRAALESVLRTSKDPALVLSEQFEEEPERMLALACKRGLEGIIAKQKGSKYVGTRSGSWLKIKCKQRQEFVIAGYLPLVGHKDAVGGLVLALHDDEGFYFAGKVGTGFSAKTREELARLLDKQRVERPMVRDVPRFGGLVRHCAPRTVCEVAFTEWTAGGNVRHPSFQGLRKDKKPEECVRELPTAPAVAETEPATKKKAARKPRRTARARSS